MIDRIGQRWGNYRLIRLLGRGGFAQVYLGAHIRLETYAAIKILTTNVSTDDQALLFAEARIIARLEHPHIVRILDFDVENGIPFIVMSYAPNGNLRQRYPKGTRLPLALICSYLKQLADALQYAHEARLIHRDIKPENMLLGVRDEILLSDFGVAIAARSSHAQTLQEIAGTVTYMAPEQIQGKPRPASDQYALGIIAYEWLTGQPPFRGHSAEVATQHLVSAPSPLHEQQPDISEQIEAVILRALAKDPHQRFADVREFAEAFEQASQRFLSSSNTPLTLRQRDDKASSLTTLPVSTKQPERVRFSRRTIVLGSAALAVLVGAGAGIAWFTLSASSHAQSAQTPEIQSQQATPTDEVGSRLVTYRGHQSPVRAMAWSPDDQHIVSGGDFFDHTAQIWNAITGKHILTYVGQHSDILALAWSHTGQRIASGCGDSLVQSEHNVQIWSAITGKRILTYTGHTQPILALAWSPDDRRIASAGADKTVQIWNAQTAKVIMIYTGHTGSVHAVSWSSDGKFIASASDDKTVQIWDAQTAAHILTLVHPNIVNTVVWSPDNTLIAAGSGSLFFDGAHAAHVWNARSGVELVNYTGHTAPVTTVAWSPDGKRIASGSTDKTVQIWQVANGTRNYVYHGHTLGVNVVGWSRNEKWIASASEDGTVQVWRA